jgi:hypothetical protein
VRCASDRAQYGEKKKKKTHYMMIALLETRRKSAAIKEGCWVLFFGQAQ